MGFSSLQLDIKSLKHITTGIGPGSFIGVRTSSIIAKMMAKSLSIPIFSTYAMLGIKSPLGKIASLIDAKKRGVFVATCQKSSKKITVLQKPTLYKEDKLKNILNDVDFVFSLEELKNKPLDTKIASFDKHALAYLSYRPNKELNLIY